MGQSTKVTYPDCTHELDPVDALLRTLWLYGKSLQGEDSVRLAKGLALVDIQKRTDQVVYSLPNNPCYTRDRCAGLEVRAPHIMDDAGECRRVCDVCEDGWVTYKGQNYRCECGTGVGQLASVYCALQNPQPRSRLKFKPFQTRKQRLAANDKLT